MLLYLHFQTPVWQRTFSGRQKCRIAKLSEDPETLLFKISDIAAADYMELELCFPFDNIQKQQRNQATLFGKNSFQQVVVQ